MKVCKPVVSGDIIIAFYRNIVQMTEIYRYKCISYKEGLNLFYSRFMLEYFLHECSQMLTLACFWLKTTVTISYICF